MQDSRRAIVLVSKDETDKVVRTASPAAMQFPTGWSTVQSLATTLVALHPYMKYQYDLLTPHRHKIGH
jgi:hypothetical protein